MADSSRKTFIVIAFSAGMSLGLLFASMSFIKSQRDREKDALMYVTSGQAKMISTNVNCSLTFDNPKDADIVLGALKTQNNIVFAGIYDCNGKLFASYYRNDINPSEFKPLQPSKAKFPSRDGYLIVSEPVIQEHQRLGTVCIWAQL